jgi:hypothetical protein
MEGISNSGSQFFIDGKVIHQTEKSVLIEWSEEISCGSIAIWKGISLNCKESKRIATFQSWIPKTIFCNMENWSYQETIFAKDWRGNVCFHDENQEHPVVLILGGFKYFKKPFWIERKEN